MTQAVLARALCTCLGLGALDVGVLNLVVLPRIGQVSPAREPARFDVAASAQDASAVHLRAKQAVPGPVSSSVPAPGVVASMLPATSFRSRADPRASIPPPEAPIAIVEFGKSWRRLDAHALAMLDEAATKLRGAPDIVVIGHADASGPDDLNERLSAERAAAVVRWLEHAGVARVRMHVEARGEREPRREGGNDRRVELYARVTAEPWPSQAGAPPLAPSSAPAPSSHGELSNESGPDSEGRGGQR